MCILQYEETDILSGQLANPNGPGMFFVVCRLSPAMKYRVTLYSRFRADHSEVTLKDWNKQTPMIYTWVSENLAMIYHWLVAHNE
jgi:hypothetical protein